MNIFQKILKFLRGEWFDPKEDDPDHAAWVQAVENECVEADMKREGEYMFRQWKYHVESPITQYLTSIGIGFEAEIISHDKEEFLRHFNKSRYTLRDYISLRDRYFEHLKQEYIKSHPNINQL